MNAAVTEVPETRPSTRLRLIGWLPPVLAALVAVPYLLRQNAWSEMNNALWVLQTQTEHVRATGLPTTFLHLPDEAFYPQHLLYGGFLFSLLAYPAVVLGAWPTLVIAVVLAFVAIERGVTWFARNLGVPRDVAPLLGLALVATPYVVSDLYGRGAFAELMALAGAALCFGAGTAVLTRPGRLPIGPSLALVGSAALVAGAHNLTLLMSALVAPVVLVIAFAGGALTTTWRRALQVILLLTAGVGLTAAFLLPTVDFAPDTWIARDDVNAILRNAALSYGKASILLSPWPKEPAGAVGGLYAQASLILLVFPVLAAIVLRRRIGRRTAIALALAIAAEILLVWLLTHPLKWTEFPQAVQTIQFPFRLIPWLGLIGVTACALVLRKQAPRALVLTLGALVALQVVTAIGLAATHDAPGVPKPASVTARNPPASFVTKGLWQPMQYLVRYLPAGPPPTYPDPPPSTDAKVEAARIAKLVRAKTGSFDPLTADVVPLGGTDKPGTVLVAPIAWSPWVRLTGEARIIGRDSDGFATILVDHNTNGHWGADARAGCRSCIGRLGDPSLGSMALGRVVTGVALLGIVAWLGFALWRRRANRAATAA